MRAKIKRQKNHAWRLNKNISKEVWAVMHGAKQGKSWKLYVKDNIKDIISHLEKLFTPEMNWENYGSFWELDHIKPINDFLHLPIEEAVGLAWKLSNLQPLEKHLNRSKQHRYIATREEFIKIKEQEQLDLNRK